MGLLGALPKRYVKCVVDANDVDLRVFAVRVGVGAPSHTVNNRAFTTRSGRVQHGCPELAEGAPRCPRRHRAWRRVPAAIADLMAAACAPPSLRRDVFYVPAGPVSSFLSYVVHALGLVARPSRR